MEIRGVLIFFGPLRTKDGGAPLPTDRISLLDRCDDGPEMLIFSKSQNRYYHLRWQSPKIICRENPRVFAARLVLDRRRGNFCSKNVTFIFFKIGYAAVEGLYHQKFSFHQCPKSTQNMSFSSVQLFKNRCGSPSGTVIWLLVRPKFLRYNIGPTQSYMTGFCPSAIALVDKNAFYSVNLAKDVQTSWRIHTDLMLHTVVCIDIVFNHTMLSICKFNTQRRATHPLVSKF